MQTAEFLRRILPPPGDGWYCWATPAPEGSKRRFDQRFTKYISHIVEGAVQCSHHRLNTYYAMSSFKERGSRAQENVAYVKSFWIDIDCGEAKAAAGQGYATKKEGAAALLTAVKNAGLPRPLVVDSGNGLHAYWPLVEAVTADVWRPVACQLVAALQERGLVADWGCSADHSRILRPAGTNNWKDKSAPKPVTVKLDCPDYTFEQIAAPLKDIVVSVPASRYGDLGVNSDLGLPQEPPSSVPDAVAQRCAQVALFRDSGGCLPEPQWRAGIAVVKACIEGEATCHEWSRGYAGYSVSETDLKISQTKGPTTCAAFERINPKGCEGCKFKGTVTSPIQLGRPEPEEVVEESVVVADPVTAEPVVVTETLPVLPETMQRAYRWTKSGMCALSKAPVAEGSEETHFVWVPFTDAFIVVREMTWLNGEVHLKLSVRRRAGMSFTALDMPAALCHDKQGMLKFLASHSISCYAGKDAEMVMYMKRWFDEARQRAEESRQHVHYGWQEDGGFLIGDRLLKPNAEMRRVSLGGDARGLFPAMQQQGTVEEWSRVINTAYGGEGMEQYKFIVAAGFGAPLMRFTGENGVTIDMVSAASGAGKTTAAQCALSIFGNPDGIGQTFGQATMNAIYTRIGAMNSLPCYVDEITLAPTNQVGALAYDITGGHQKDRVSRSGDAKEPKAVWQTIVIASGNTSLWQKVANSRDRADAQMLRVLEYRLSQKFSVDQEAARQLFGSLARNYGVAGDVFIQYVIDNYDGVQKLVSKVMTHIERKAKMVSNERFWLAGVAASIAGVTIARQLGLVAFDVNSLLDWCVKRIVESRSEVNGSTRTAEGSFSTMVAELQGGVIVTDKMGDETTPAFVTKRPAGAVFGRLVAEDHTLWISTAAVADWCSKNNADLKEMLQAARASGELAGTDTFNLGVGTDVPTLPAKCYIIKM